MKSINVCPMCDGDFESIANFCGHCGYDLRPHQIKLPCCGTMFIPKPEGSNKYCPFCGQPREQATQAEARS